jgi:hypothetical protein
MVTFLFKTFRRLDSVSVFRWNLLTWAQSIELVPVSRHLHIIKVTLRLTVSQSICIGVELHVGRPLRREDGSVVC